MSKSELFWSYSALFLAGIIALLPVLKQDDSFLEYSYCTFVVITFYSFLGMLIYGGQTPSDDLIMWHSKMRMLVNNLAIPCYTADVWLKHGILQQQVVAWLYILLGCIPALMCALEATFYDSFFIDGLVYTNCTTCSAISAQNGNVYGVLATICFMSGYYIYRKEKYLYERNHSPETSFNLFTTGFVICATASLKGR